MRASVASKDIFSGTLRDNLDPAGTHGDRSLLEACARVGVRFPAGLDTRLSANGLSISVGERQLLCLARALLVGAGLILLDEATSSLSDSTRAPVDAALAACSRGTHRAATVVQIAHQTAAVMSCDEVLVMVASRLAERGPPKALLEGRCGEGLFASLVQHDARGQVWAGLFTLSSTILGEQPQ